MEERNMKLTKGELQKLEEEMLEKASVEVETQEKPIIKISLSETVAKELKEKLICLRKK